MLLEFNLQITRENKTVKITPITTRIDATNSIDFEYALLKYAEFYDIVFDFKNIDYISSNAIGAIIQIYKTLNKFDNTLTVINYSSSVERVLEIAGIKNKIIKQSII